MGRANFRNRLGSSILPSFPKERVTTRSATTSVCRSGETPNTDQTTIAIYTNEFPVERHLVAVDRGTNIIETLFNGGIADAINIIMRSGFVTRYLRQM